MRVVIADDQRVVREGLATIVGSFAGIEVVATAEDGAEAVALCGQHHPEVVLMDLRMPKMDGTEATAAIRAQFPETRVVVLTTYRGRRVDLLRAVRGRDRLSNQRRRTRGHTPCDRGRSCGPRRARSGRAAASRRFRPQPRRPAQCPA